MKLPILGEIVFWRMSNVKVSTENAIELAKNLNLSIDLPSEVSKMHIVRRTLETLLKTSNEDIIWRKSKDHTYYIGSVKVSDGIETETSMSVIVKSSSNSFSFEFEGSNALIERFKNNFNTWEGCLDSELMGSIFVSFIERKLSGIRIRKGGGVYFVRADKLDLLNSFEQWCNTISGISLSRVKLVDEARAKNEIVNLFVAKIGEDLGEIQGYITRVMNEDLRKNKKGLETRINVVEGMRTNLELYRDMLGDKKEEIEKLVDDVKASLLLLKFE